MQTAILTGCKCGWVGMAHSSAAALENWYQHHFDARGGFHERVGEMAVSNPLNALGSYRIREEAVEQARLTRWKSYQKEHDKIGVLLTSAIVNSPDFGFRTTTDEPLPVAEGRLRRGALAALAMAGGIALAVLEIWRML